MKLGLAVVAIGLVRNGQLKHGAGEGALRRDREQRSPSGDPCCPGSGPQVRRDSRSRQRAVRGLDVSPWVGFPMVSLHASDGIEGELRTVPQGGQHRHMYGGPPSSLQVQVVLF